MSDAGHGGKRQNAGRPKGAKTQKKKTRNSNSLFADRTDAQHKRSERSKAFVQKSDEELRKFASSPNPYDANRMAANIEIKRRLEEEEKRKREEEEKKEREQLEREQKEQKEEEEAMAGLLRLAQDADECLNAHNKEQEADEDEEAEDYDLDTEAFLAGNPNKPYDQSRRNKAGYKPSNGSILFQELENFRENFMTPMSFHRNGILKGRHEFPPEFDPVSKDGAPDPKSWYTGRCKKFVYLPFHQYHNKAGQLKDYACVHCHEKDLESKMFAYRPMFNFAEIVWLYHRRVKCKRCFGTFAEIHPDFLSQLPTVVAERLPFLTTGAGLGVHRLMLYQFMHLATKGILYGTFTSMYNELYRVDHDMEHCSFLDVTADYRSGVSALGVQLKNPEPFAAFRSPGEYNGILLRIGLMKHLFYRTMDSLEAYMQKSFQSSVDNGESPDHTFKFANGLKLKDRPGKVFTASYTSVSRQGKVTLSRPTYTKSNAEIEPIIARHHEARKNAGEATLDIYQSDGGSDQSVWRKEFKEDLARGMTPFVPTKIDDFPGVHLESHKYREMKSQDAANDWCLGVIECISKLKSGNDKIYYGLDCEWNWRDGTHELTRAVQIYFPENITPTAAFINLGKMQAFLPDSFPRDLKRLLELEYLIPVGVNISVDVARLRKLGVNVKHWIDVSLMAKELDDGQKNPHGYGMKALCARHLSIGVDKRGQDSDWAQDPLPSELVHYGVLDTCLSLRLFHVLRDLLEAKNNSFPLRVDSKLRVSSAALYACRRDKPPSATVEVVFIGGLGGEQRKWGMQTVGKGKSLVRLKKAHNSSAKPPFSFTPHWQERGVKAWDKRSLTLEKVLEEFDDPIILVLTSKLSLPASENYFQRDDNEGEVTRAEREEEVNPFPGEHQNKEGEEKDTNPSSTIAIEQEEDLRKSAAEEAVEYVISGKAGDRSLERVNEPYGGDSSSNDLDDDLVDKTRDKRDIFHVFDELPIARNNPARTLISRLLIHATFLFDDEDYENVAKYLAEKKEIDSLEDILKDFYFRREWWRRRVRMYTPRGSEHASNIRIILEFVENTDAINDELDKHTLEEVQKYLERFAEKCEEGRFEELADVNLFQWDGKDKSGLDLWLRLRGSTRTENVHQKMRVAFGPWSTGIRTGHYLLLLICYRYNVSTGIRRCNAHDFGHTWLHFNDRIDSRLQEFHGVSVFPRHINLSLFEPLKNFVNVGIGPLFFDEAYVESGDADARLLGDLLFLATRMMVKCPPLPISSQEEYTFFNAFILLHPKPTDSDFRALAKEFKAKANCTTIFPKLPSMLKVHYKTWKDTNLIKMTEAAMKKVYNELLQKFATPVREQAKLSGAVEDNLIAVDIAGDDNRSLAVATEDHDDNEQNDGNAGLVVPLDVESDDGEPQQPRYKLQVAPINAPKQLAYVPSKSGKNKTFNCYYFPFCKRKRHECGGNERGKCSDVISGKINPEPTDEEISKAKILARSQARTETRKAKKAG